MTSDGTTKPRMLSLRNKTILGPMVRVSTFPFRQICLHHGCDIVFGQEIADHQLINANRKNNATLDTIDIVDKAKETRLVFRTLRHRQEPVICQIGSCDAIKFLKASIKVCKCVHGIDLNMGCPKSFSVHKGMGAALLCPKKINLVHDMLTTFKRNKVSNQTLLTVKIRLLKSEKATIELVQMLEKCGVDGITVHARYTEDRSEAVPARRALVGKNVCSVVRTPIIYNGDVFAYSDIAKFKKYTHCDGVMVSRGAINNPSVFNMHGMQNIHDVAAEYMDIAKKYDYGLHPSKFVVEKMLLAQAHIKKSSDLFRQFHASTTYKECQNVNYQLQKI